MSSAHFCNEGPISRCLQNWQLGCSLNPNLWKSISPTAGSSFQRYGASQFMGLTDAEYQCGIDSIKSAINKAEAVGKEAVFKSEIQLKMAVGRIQG